MQKYSVVVESTKGQIEMFRNETAILLIETKLKIFISSVNLEFHCKIIHINTQLIVDLVC